LERFLGWKRKLSKANIVGEVLTKKVRVLILVMKKAVLSVTLTLAVFLEDVIAPILFVSVIQDILNQKYV
jgi:hypothetical protein